MIRILYLLLIVLFLFGSSGNNFYIIFNINIIYKDYFYLLYSFYCNGHPTINKGK